MTSGLPSDAAPLWLPSGGPEPLPVPTALTAVVGYACGRRPLRFRSPGAPEGRWVEVPAFGWSRFDARCAGKPGDVDVLVAEGLHGRLDRAGWVGVHDALEWARPLAAAAAERAGGRAFWELPDEELSVLGEPGTVGALLRAVREDSGASSGPVLAALHHRHPRLVAHLTPATRRALLPHTEEGDSGIEAVVHRELAANAAPFALLEDAVATATGVRVTRLRLHDILLWLRTTLRFTHALALAQAAASDGPASATPVMGCGARASQ